MNGSEIELRVVCSRESIQKLFANYDAEYFHTEEIDWGNPHGSEVW